MYACVSVFVCRRHCSLPKGGGTVCNLSAGRAAENNYVHGVATEMRQSVHAIMERTVDTWALSCSGIV